MEVSEELRRYSTGFVRRFGCFRFNVIFKMKIHLHITELPNLLKPKWKTHVEKIINTFNKVSPIKIFSRSLEWLKHKDLLIQLQLLDHKVLNGTSGGG